MTTFTISGSDFAVAVGGVAKFVPSKALHPILNGILIEIGEDAARFSAHDTEITAVYTADVEPTGPGKFIVPGRILATVAKYVGKSDVRVSLEDDGRVHVSAGRSASWQLPTLTVEDYPQLPSPGELVGQCPGPEFREALARVLPAADREGIAPMWGAVQLRTDSDDLEIASSDSFRIALAHIPWTPALHDASSNPPVLNMRLPRHFVDAATRVIGADDAPIKIHQRVGTVTLAGQRQCLTGRLVAHEWPDIYAPLPTRAVRSATINVADLTAAVDRVLAVTDGRPGMALMSHPVRFEIDREHITLSIKIDDNAATADCQVSDYDAPPMIIALNPLFLHDCLKTMKTELAELWLGGKNTKPLAFYPIDENGKIIMAYQHVMMPVKPQKVGADIQ